MASSRDTIFALSSGRPPAAIGVVRLSGPRAGDALKALTGKIPEPRKAALARVRDPANGEVIDEALALWFPGPKSETGEDTAELQLHGGRAVIAAVLTALGRLEGLRMAEPGEFTRRAFENGHLDLTAVEGLADLIGAETEAQRRQAYRQLKGLLGDRAEDWRKRLIEALALVEARIDFSDEADVPEDLVGPALKIAAELCAEIGAALSAASRGERLRDGLVVAIAGPPNAGKSTLLNRIARREAAIVSPIAGTTRDVIEVHLDLGGYPVTVLDTAGMRHSDDPIEQEGVRRATERAAAADLVLWVEDVTELTSGVTPPKAPVVWSVKNKIDLDRRIKDKTITQEFELSNMMFYISSLTEQGFISLMEQLGKYAVDYFGSEPALVSRERQRKLLEAADRALQAALAEGVQGREDIIAEELRVAANALGRLTGRVDVEDILDVIFRDFCIGK
jgi:tRNA modification GTPase